MALPPDAEAFNYIVADGDSLQSISLRYNIPIFQLKQLNNKFINIVPGDCLVIPTKYVEPVWLSPIDSQIFNRKIPVDGALILLDDYIRFEPYSRSIKPLMLSLKGFIASTIEPHPCELCVLPDEILTEDSLSLLHVHYLNEENDESSYQEIVFTGKLLELTAYQKVMEQKAKSVQSLCNIMPIPLSRVQLPKPTSTVSQVEIPRIAFDEGESTVLEAANSADLRGALPRRFRGYQWNLKFRLSRDGCSFTSFSGVIKKVKCAVMLIKTNCGDVIGCFASTGFQINTRQYYSSGESFVFSFTPSFTPFRWARTTQFFINVTAEELSVGGGGAAALWIDGNFLNAFSEKCNAFNSPPLASKIEFKIEDLEVWEVGH